MPLAPGTKQNAVLQMYPADIFWIFRQESQYLTGPHKHQCGAKCSSTTFGGAVQIPFSLPSTGSVCGLAPREYPRPGFRLQLVHGAGKRVAKMESGLLHQNWWSCILPHIGVCAVQLSTEILVLKSNLCQRGTFAAPHSV